MSAPPVQFAHGARVYHRVRRQFGGVIVQEKLDVSPSSVCVQFEGKADIEEVSAALLCEVKDDTSLYAPGKKLRLKNDPRLREYAGQEVTIVEFHAEYSAGKSYVVAFEDGTEDILNEAHFEAAEAVS